MKQQNKRISILKFRKDDKRIDEINKARKDAALPPIEQIERKCLKCDKVFITVGNGQRICNRCKDHKMTKMNAKFSDGL